MDAIAYDNQIIVGGFLKTTTSPMKLASLRAKHDAAVSELESYKLLVENIEDYAIFMMDPNGYILTWNKGARKQKGYLPQEIIGRHFSTFYLPQDIEAGKPERELVLAKKFGHVEDEDWRVKKDGTKFWANVIITSLYDSTGRLVGFAKVTRNLTIRKQHEDSLRKANIALRQQQRELEALNVSKDEFVSLASHQLRTPATVIKQLLGLLLEGYVGEVFPSHYEIIKKAYDSNERQLAIVNSLLKVAQLDAGKVILKKIPTDVMKLLKSILDDYADTFEERKQNYKLSSDATFGEMILLDADHFRMAIENLIDNASKYTPKGGAIHVHTDLHVNNVRISIKDNGVGIAPQHLDKLFQRFSRIPNELPNVVPGSGLGLYWAHKVIGLHGGKMEVESDVDSGTTFHVLIPQAATYA